MNFRDAEILSVYLDGQLNPADSTRLEKRLAIDPDLRRLLDDLRVARGLLRQVPRLKAPRNFTLKPQMAGLRAPEPRTVPALRFASVLAAFLFVATLAVNGLAPLASRSLAAAPAPAFGLGGGGGGVGGGPVATEAPLQSFAAQAPTGLAPEATLAPGDRAAATSAAAAEAAPKIAPPAPSTTAPLRGAPPPPVSPLWQVMVASAAVLLGALAWYLHQRSQRDFRRRWSRK